jgi:hypothetical protein
VFIMFVCNVTVTDIPNPRGKKGRTMIDALKRIVV